MDLLIINLSSSVILLDQIIKIFAKKFFIEKHFNYGFINFVYVENPGGVFGILSNNKYLWLASSLLFLIIFLYVFLKVRVNPRIYEIAGAFILGGGCSNLIDRFFYGYVIDYINLSFFTPICNFADYFISLGAIIFGAYILFYKKSFFK